MAEDIGSLAVSIGMDASGFTTGMTQINRNLRVLDSGFRANTAAVGLNGTELDRLRIRSGNLSSTMVQQQNKVDALQAAYDRSATATGRDSAATQNLEIRLNQARASLSNMGNQLGTVNAQIATQSSNWTTMGNSLVSASEKMKKVGETTTSVGKKLTVGLTAPILGIGIASTKVGNEFESAMSKVKAISGATGDSFKKLNDQALQLGQDTAFSAKEAADGMENLASAGFSVTEIMQSMPGMLDMAASSGLDVATASDIAASSLRGFGLEASQSGHVADVLAKAAADTNANVTDMGEALKYAAPPAHALGMSIEEVSAAIGIMSNSGIKGSQAGTTLRGSLIALASPTDVAITRMKQLGFEAFDAKGKMLPFKDVIDRLKTSTNKLTQEKKADALATIFGKEALSGMMTLIEAGPDKIDTLTESFKASDGAAKKMAETMQDNAKSSVEQMLGSLETAGIKITQAVAPTIRKLAIGVQDLANKFSNLSPEMQGTIIKVALAAAAIGPLVVGIGTVITAVGAITGVLGTASIAMGVTTAATVGVGVAGATASTGVVGLGVAFGAALIPILPFIAVGAAVVGTALAINHAMKQEAIPAVDLFADAVATTTGGVNSNYATMSSGVETNTVKISTSTKKAVGAYIDLDTKATKSLTDLYLNGTIITEKTSKSLTDIYTQMGMQIKTVMDKDFNEQYIAMKAFFDKSGALSKEEEAQILANLKSNNEGKTGLEDFHKKEIFAILKKAKDEKRAITLEEQIQINVIQNNMKTNAVKALSQNELESKIIMQRLKDFGTRVTADQASEIIKNANKSRDGAVKGANETYDKSVAAIIKMRDESHTITADQANKLIADAKRQKDKIIEHAETLRYEAVAKIRSMNKDIDSSVDTTTGNLITKWDKFKRWWFGWTPESKNLNVNTDYTSTGRRAQVQQQWTGTNNFSGGLTTMHEKGYEVYNLPQSSQILNHEASLDLVTKTAEMVAKNVLANNKSGSGLNLKIDNFINNRTQDVESLATELTFYMKQKNLGGSR